MNSRGPERRRHPHCCQDHRACGSPLPASSFSSSLPNGVTTSGFRGPNPVPPPPGPQKNPSPHGSEQPTRPGPAPWVRHQRPWDQAPDRRRSRLRSLLCPPGCRVYKGCAHFLVPVYKCKRKRQEGFWVFCCVGCVCVFAMQLLSRVGGSFLAAGLASSSG